MQQIRTTINANGRLFVPILYRKAPGIEPGDELIMRFEEGEIRITNLKQALKRARGAVKQYIRTKQDLTQSLIDDRRKEAALE
jgi:bifunctional DNA-binding transcriptional regulator/antitoxin component of YhaV-PrlF toxin-antitoxin module